MSADLLAHLRAREEQLFLPAIRRSPADLTRYLSPDFREIGRSGRLYDYEQTVASLSAETQGAPVTADDFRLQILAPTVALLTYRSQADGPDGPRITLRSSIWREDPGHGWRMVFHQGTPTAGAGAP